MKTVLVVAAHPDDEILGVGATVARHVAMGDTVYAIRLYPEEREAVEEKLLIPYQGKIRGISMVDTKKEAEWKMTEEGIQVVISQEYREGETPIAIVWKIEQ